MCKKDREEQTEVIRALLQHAIHHGQRGDCFLVWNLDQQQKTSLLDFVWKFKSHPDASFDKELKDRDNRIRTLQWALKPHHVIRGGRLIASLHLFYGRVKSHP